MSGRNAPAFNTSTAGGSDDWRDDAACLDHDPELFWPVGTTGPAVQQIRMAKEVCGWCPVIAECRDYALDNSLTEGIWGGLDEQDRRRIKRRGSRVAAVNPRRPGTEYDDASTTRRVITVLREAGKTYAEIGHLLGTSKDRVHKIGNGTQAVVLRDVADAAARLAAHMTVSI